MKIKTIAYDEFKTVVIRKIQKKTLAVSSRFVENEFFAHSRFVKNEKTTVPISSKR